MEGPLPGRGHLAACHPSPAVPPQLPRLPLSTVSRYLLNGSGRAGRTAGGTNDTIAHPAPGDKALKRGPFISCGEPPLCPACIPRGRPGEPRPLARPGPAGGPGGVSAPDPQPAAGAWPAGCPGHRRPDLGGCRERGLTQRETQSIGLPVRLAPVWLPGPCSLLPAVCPWGCQAALQGGCGEGWVPVPEAGGVRKEGA